jgi:hypothetical protein
VSFGTTIWFDPGGIFVLSWSTCVALHGGTTMVRSPRCFGTTTVRTPGACSAMATGSA